MKRLLHFLKKYAVAAAGCVFLLFGGFFFKKHRDLLAQIAIHFRAGRGGYPLPPCLLPQITEQQRFPDHHPVIIQEPNFVKGNVSLHELLIMARAARLFRPQNVFEFGTFDGRTTLNLAANIASDAQVITLDLPRAMMTAAMGLEKKERILVEKEKSGERFLNRPEASKIKQVYGDSASFDFSPYEGRIDFVFIDASHAYSYVINDSRIGLKLLRKGKGVIFWHDYVGEWAGVTRALNDLYKSKGPFGNMVHIRNTSLAFLALP